MYNVFLNLFSVLLLYVTKKQVEYILRYYCKCYSVCTNYL